MFSWRRQQQRFNYIRQMAATVFHSTICSYRDGDMKNGARY